MTAEQLRAARAMLKISQEELARLSDVSLDTIKRLERMRGTLVALTTTISALRDALEAEGVVFLDEGREAGGVRLRRRPAPNIRQSKLRSGSE